MRAPAGSSTAYERDEETRDQEVEPWGYVIPATGLYMQVQLLVDRSAYENQSRRVVRAFAAPTPSDETGVEFEPLADPDVHAAAVRLVLQAEALGVSSHHWDAHDMHLMLSRVFRALEDHGIGRALIASLRHGADIPGWRLGLRELSERLESSPVPTREWRVLLSIFDEASLSLLLSIDVDQLRAYSSGEPTPDDVAARVHFMSLVVADLRTGYNDYGIRRWFQRGRGQLGGRSPGDLLLGDWSPGTPDAELVRRLAHGVVFAGGT